MCCEQAFIRYFVHILKKSFPKNREPPKKDRNATTNVQCTEAFYHVSVNNPRNQVQLLIHAPKVRLSVSNFGVCRKYHNKGFLFRGTILA